MPQFPEDTGAVSGCSRCRDSAPVDFDFAFAYQPIASFHSRKISAHEALVRGIKGGSAATVLAQVNDDIRDREKS